MTTGTYLKLAKDQGEIMDNKQARDWHRMLDRLAEGNTLSPQNIESLRKALPELPNQKTLEEIAWDIDFAWAETVGNDWRDEMFGDLESWLSELHAQLRAHLEGVKSQAHPALPAGMRLADHVNFGRVVVSPEVGVAMCYEIFHLDPGFSSGTDISGVEPESLTFLDSEPAHPAFLETENDYESAPEGTVVARADELPRTKKEYDRWDTDGGDCSDYVMALSHRSRVLRWGWGE